MAITGHEFKSLARGSTGAIATPGTANIFTVPANQRWEVHSASLIVTVAVGTTSFFFEISDTAGANFQQFNPRFSGGAGGLSFLVELAPRTITNVNPSAPTSLLGGTVLRNTLFLRKFEAGQILRVNNVAGLLPITNVFFEVTGILETTI